MGFLTNILNGGGSAGKVKRLNKTIDKIESLERVVAPLTDEELKSKTQEFKQRLTNGETVDDILPEAFAVAREASKRVLDMYPYRVQLIGGVVLHQGRIAEMKTGEGKTLVALMPTYLNALTGKSVHVVTVNDYLAKRDADLIGRVHKFLGLTVGYITHDVPLNKRKEMYNCDVIYGTNNEFGFDYLRDNMVTKIEDVVQRDLAFAIVDEVDSILIDEARTPLIISSPSDIPSSEYIKADKLAKTLQPLYVSETDKKEVTDDYDCDVVIDEKNKSTLITANGYAKIEKYYNIEDCSAIENSETMHFVSQAIKANYIMKKDTDYLIKDGQILIIDEFTGRIMFGRRYNDGLHQAIEAKENVEVNRESVTKATITFQNYFRMYNKLSGMTGTAMTEETEFGEIYSLDVVEIPTNKPIIRKDHNDVMFTTVKAKEKAIVEQVKECNLRGQPVLVGTVSVEKSEKLSKRLKAEGIKHTVLNAKYHEKEADIVAQAGRYGAVTIATNMAGRGTDIMLGGNPESITWANYIKPLIRDRIAELKSDETNDNAQEISNLENLHFEDLLNYSGDDEFKILLNKELHKNLEVETRKCNEEHNKVVEAGGLFIIGTERHESRRIDNQLRGRSGRQGDPGESRFFLSMEDDLMRLFGGERAKAMLQTLNIDDDMPIEAKPLTKIVQQAQIGIESNHYAVRKNVLKFDDVINKQRELIYKQRREVMESDDIHGIAKNMISKYADWTLAQLNSSGEIVTSEDIEELLNDKAGICFFNPEDINVEEPKKNLVDKYTGKSVAEVIGELKKQFMENFENKFKAMPESVRNIIERHTLLSEVDARWIEHIDTMDQMQKGIFLRAYAQQDPFEMYQREGMDMFEDMNHSIVVNTAVKLMTCTFRVQVNIPKSN